MNRDIDTICQTAPYNVSFFPTITSNSNFDINSYVSQLSAIEELQGDIATTLYEVPTPSKEEIMQIDREVFSATGDKRFTGIDAHNFLHTRYKALDVGDTFTDALPTITLTACDIEGEPYTYTVKNTAYFLDQKSNKITFPVYDVHGRQVHFPLIDEAGKFILHQPITAIDAIKQVVFFPLKDINNAEVHFPFKDAAGSTIIVPPAGNSENLLDVTVAYAALDTAYENAKDADAFKFCNFLLNLERSNKISFFFGTSTISTQNASYFAAAVYDLSIPQAELSSIVSSNLKYFIRYYPDRADKVYELYTESGGSGPFTIIKNKEVTTIQESIENDRERFASYNILTIPFWDETKTSSSFYTAEGITTPVQTVHTSLLEIYTNVNESREDVSTLQAQVQTLSTLVNELSTKLISLQTAYNTTASNVTFNSGVIDTLISPNNWQNIWETTISAGFIRPGTPTARP